MRAKVSPLGDRILVKRLEAESQTQAGIFIPDSAKEKPMHAQVISVGPGKLLDNGKRAPVRVKAGATVLLSKWGGTEITLDSEEYVFIKEEEVLAIVE